MAYQNDHTGLTARMIWAFFTPVILAFGLIFLPLIPALCLYLDGKSRTYTGAVTVLLAAVAISLLYGPAAAAVSAFVVVTTAGAYVLARVKMPFSTGLVGSAGAGVLGAVALLGILSASAGEPINEIAAAWFCNALAAWQFPQGYPPPLDVFAAQYDALQQGATGFQLFVTVPKQILDMATGEKIAIVQPVMEQFFAAYIPAWALVGGMLTGGLGYYLPQLAQAIRRRESADSGENVSIAVDVPPFASFKVPKYIVITLLLLQLVSQPGLAGGGFAALNVSATLLFNTLMIVQALSLLSFLLNRKKIGAVLQFVILVPVTALFFWMLSWVGFFDAIFDMRTVMAKVDTVRSKGKQVFTPGGLDELRNMDNTKDKKNGKDGEEDKK